MSISKNLLRTAFVFALALAGCDDDEPLTPTDAARETGTPDVPRDTPVSTDTPRVDVAPDAGDTRPADTATDVATDVRIDGGADTLPNLDVAADSADARADVGDVGDGGDGGGDGG